jgi:ribonuclease HI
VLQYPIVETSIVLDDFTLSEVKDLITRKNCFDLHNHLDNTTHQFCSESAEVALEWLKALKQGEVMLVMNSQLIRVQLQKSKTRRSSP